MPNLNSILNEHIRRLARREIKANTKSTRAATARYRRDIAALKRELGAMARRLQSMEKRGPVAAAAGQSVPEELMQKARFRADGLRSHRAKLGLSAKDYGKLVGVAGLTIYQWEHGKAHPRRAQLAKLLAVRGIGKREAMQRLGQDAPRGAGAPGAPAGKRRVRGKFSRTAEDMIKALVGTGKGASTAQINAAWKKEGRAGSADNTLSLMVRNKALSRAKVKGVRGSMYTLA